MSANIVPLVAGGKIRGIVPTTIEEVFRLATAISKSGLAPNGMKSAEQITIAIMHGLEIGLPPMQAVQRVSVINGRPTIWGDAIPALLQSKGFKIRERMAGGEETRCAICEVTRPDGEVIERVFSKTDAITAGLWGKAGPWKQYPDRMLQMRARGYAARDGAADVLSGLYLREELDEEPRDITPPPAREVVTPGTSKALPPIVGETIDADPLQEVRDAIDEASSLQVLEHVREIFPDADWTALEQDYDAKCASFA